MFSRACVSQLEPVVWRHLLDANSHRLGKIRSGLMSVRYPLHSGRCSSWHGCSPSLYDKSLQLLINISKAKGLSYYFLFPLKFHKAPLFCLVEQVMRTKEPHDNQQRLRSGSQRFLCHGIPRIQPSNGHMVAALALILFCFHVFLNATVSKYYLGWVNMTHGGLYLKRIF